MSVFTRIFSLTVPASHQGGQDRVVRPERLHSGPAHPGESVRPLARSRQVLENRESEACSLSW